MSSPQSDVGAVPAGGSSGSSGGGATGASAGASAGPSEDLRERPLPELVKQLADQTSTLVRQEIVLAKAEMSEKGKEAGKGAGMLGGAALLGLLASIAFTAFLILLLGTFLPNWLAALIVTVLYAAIAAGLALAGKKELQQIQPAPEETIDSVKEDVEWAKTQSRFARK